VKGAVTELLSSRLSENRIWNRITSVVSDGGPDEPWYPARVCRSEAMFMGHLPICKLTKLPHIKHLSRGIGTGLGIISRYGIWFLSFCTCHNHEGRCVNRGETFPALHYGE
jgi:hypothetical protein